MDKKFDEASSLVIKTDRSHIPKETTTGEAESLQGRIDPKEFGSKAQRSKPDSKLVSKEDNHDTVKKASAAKRLLARSRGLDILDVTAGFEVGMYQPKTRESRNSYEMLLNFVLNVMGDQPRDVIRGATDEVLKVLKSEDGKDFDRKKQVEELLGAEIESSKFSQLVNLTKKITDYSIQETEDDVGQEGVAVVFDDEEEEEEDLEIREQDSEDENDETDIQNDQIDDVQDDQFQEKKDDRVSVHDVDAYWLQRQISVYYKDAMESQNVSNQVLEILERSNDSRECENELVLLLEFDKFPLVKLLTRNRLAVIYGTRLARATEEEKGAILSEIQSHPELNAKIESSVAMEIEKVLPTDSGPMNIDLEDLVSRTTSNKSRKIILPENTKKRQRKGFEEIYIPAPPSTQGDEVLVPISDLPSWAQPAFAGSKTLNRIQSRVHKVALYSNENMLICAPTGAGKTNCAMMTVLAEISKHIQPDGTIETDSLKMIYIAPMKALVAEMVATFSKRLKDYGITVAELTGDRQLTKAQIAETQLIVTTPEKWDVITRKNNDRSYTNLVGLIIIDEIHLLHDDRGPVLESIVSRSLRLMEQNRIPVRLVGLSATLPNYHDVAKFLRVDQGLFHFDNSYRPCPLHQTYIGISERKALKRFNLMNEICYEKVLDQAGKNQVLVFVQSRRETVKTAKMLRDTAIDKETIGRFVKNESSKLVLKTECKNADLSDLLPYGFAVHHAGMSRVDRSMVEEMFSQGHIQVLVSTSTLAWGVNLPAHTVIIKGTQMYSPEKGQWVELSPQDIFQMMGRAGRPQFDKFGEGIIITSHSELQYYLSLLNQQLPIESRFISRLVDNLNAEIVLGTVKNRDQGVEWLGYTYLYVRMLVEGQGATDDEFLLKRRRDLIHSAALVLDKNLLIRYDRKTGAFQSTEMGRIASHYYISHQSMLTYLSHLKPSMGDIELFRVFSLSSEFQYIPIRDEEKLELTKLLDHVPIPIKESIEEPAAKINCLLQSYISCLKLDGFALVSDMVYVTQSAGRIMRAIFEICLRQGWYNLSNKALDLCKMIDHRMWQSMSPLRQFSLNKEIIRRLEVKELAWFRYYDMTAQELGELCRTPKMGKTIHSLIKQFPRIEAIPHVQPISRSMLKVECLLRPLFEMQSHAEVFWVMVDDGETVLFADQFVLKKAYSNDDHIMSFTVPLFDPLPNNYFLSIASDRWLGSLTRVCISLKFYLPEKNQPPTELLDLLPISVPESIRENFGFDVFNAVQTQVFNRVYCDDDNLLVCAPTGSGKQSIAVLALLRLFNKSPNAIAVYIVPKPCMLKPTLHKFNVAIMTGNASDVGLLKPGTVVMCTPKQFDAVSRRWKQRKAVQAIDLVVADEIHMLASDPIYEIVMSRARFMSLQLEKSLRIVALATPIANAKDVGDWLAAQVFNFVNCRPIEIHLQGINNNHYSSFMDSIRWSCWEHVNEGGIVFVGGRKQAKITCQEFVGYGGFDCGLDGLDSGLDGQEYLRHGIAYIHSNTSNDQLIEIESLFHKKIIKVLVVTRDMSWALSVSHDTLVIMNTLYYEGREHRYVDYPVSDILQMIGKSTLKCFIYCPLVKKDFYKKFLNEPIPVESHLDHFLHDHFNSEIVTRTIENKQDAVEHFTWTLLYRRMTLNPTYYGLTGTTHRHLSDHLSELVEKTISDLVDSGCISIENDFDVSANNLGMIACYYGVNYMTMETFSMSLTSTTRLRGILEIICAAIEFQSLPIRHHEQVILMRIYSKLPVKISNVSFSDPRCKAHVLLQAHFSRFSLPPDLDHDRLTILNTIIPLLYAIVDTISSHGWLNPAIAAMELCQMCVQAMWDKDSPLKQTNLDLELCQGIQTVYDFMDLEEQERAKVIGSSDVGTLVAAVNRYPNIDVEFNVDGQVIDTCSLNIKLSRDDDGQPQPVIAPYYPGRKEESWWLVVGDPKTKTLHSIKRVTFWSETLVKMEFNVVSTGVVELKLYLICDSYVGCDQEYDFKINVVKPDEDMEGEDDDDDGEDVKMEQD